MTDRIEEVEEEITGHTTDRADEPTDSGKVIVAITQISDTQGGDPDYVVTADYVLGATGTIDWSPGGDEPASLAAYWATFTYVNGVYVSDWLDIGSHADSSVTVLADSAVGLDLDVIVSNIPTNGRGKAVNASAITGNDHIPLAGLGARYVQAKINALTSGKVGATWAGSLRH